MKGSRCDVCKSNLLWCKYTSHSSVKYVWLKLLSRKVWCGSILGSICVWGSDEKPSVVEQTGLMRMWMGRGSFCFNCLKSLANSLRLECGMTSTLTLLHSLSCSLSLCAIRWSSSSWEDSPSRRQCRNRPNYHSSYVSVTVLSFPPSHFCLACLTFMSVSHTLDGCARVCVCTIMLVWMDMFPNCNEAFIFFLCPILNSFCILSQLLFFV